MENIIWGVLLTLGAGLVAWLGIRHRRKARQQYEADSRRYTAVTTMTIESLEASEEEWWRAALAIFLCAAFLLVFAVMTFAGEVYISRNTQSRGGASAPGVLFSSSACI